jgi:hypothetical protein
MLYNVKKKKVIGTLKDRNMKQKISLPQFLSSLPSVQSKTLSHFLLAAKQTSPLAQRNSLLGHSRSKHLP